MAYLMTPAQQLQPRCTYNSRMAVLQSHGICQSAVTNGIVHRRVLIKASAAVGVTTGPADVAAAEAPKRRRRRAQSISLPNISGTGGSLEALSSTDEDSRFTAASDATATATIAQRSRRVSNSGRSAPSTEGGAAVGTNISRGEDAAQGQRITSQQQPGPAVAPSAEDTTAQLQQLEHISSLPNLQHITATFNQQTSPAVLALAIKQCLKVPVADSQAELVVAEFLEQLWQLQQAQLQDCSSADLALMVRALCRAPYGLKEQYESIVMQQLVPQFLQLLSTASAKDIAVVLHALSTAKLQLSAHDMRAVVRSFIAVLHDAIPQSVCLVLWGAVSMQYRLHPHQLQQILGAFEQMLPPPASVNFAQAALRNLGLGKQAAYLGQQLRKMQQLLSQELDPPGLTRLICDCKHTAALARLVTEHSTAMNHVHMATALRQVVKLAPKGSNNHLTLTDKVFDQLWMQQQAQLDSCPPETLVNIVHTFMLAPDSIKQRYPDAILQQLLPAFMRQLPNASAYVVAHMLNELADHTSSNQKDVAVQAADLARTVLMLVQQFSACGRQATAMDVATVCSAVVQMGIQLQQDKLQPLLDVFVAQNPTVKAEKKVVEVLRCNGSQEQAKKLQDNLGLVRGPKWLSKTISTAGQLELLRWLVDNHSAVFNQNHIAAAIAQAVKLQHSSSTVSKDAQLGSNNQQLQEQDSVVLQRLLNQLWQLQEQQLQSCSSNALALMVESFCSTTAAVQRLFWPAVTQQLVPCILQKRGQQQATSCAAAAHAVVAAAEQQQLQLDAQQVHQLLDVVFLQRKRQQLDAKALCKAVCAAANVNYSIPSQVMQEIVDKVLQSIGDVPTAADCIGPSEIARLTWSVAVTGHQLPKQQSEQLLYQFYRYRKSAGADTVASMLWAVAKMGERPSLQQLQQLLTVFVNKLQSSSFTAVADVTWACAKFGYLRKDYLSQPTVLGAVPTATSEQVAQLALACGELGYHCEPLLHAVMKRILQLQRDSPVQALVDACWAVALLDLQHNAAEALQLISTVSKQWAQLTGRSTALQQLYQVHLWLQDNQLEGGRGLLGVLTPQQLQECQAAHRTALTAAAVDAEPWLLLSVFTALQQLPLTWREPPQFQQYTSDGAVLVDITARTAQGEQLALFMDDSTSFSQPDGLPIGRVQFRDKLLSARGYRIVSVLAEQWRQLKGQHEQQQQYLLQLVAGQDNASPPILQQALMPGQQNVEQSNPGQIIPASGSNHNLDTTMPLENSGVRRVRRPTVDKARVSVAAALADYHSGQQAR